MNNARLLASERKIQPDDQNSKSKTPRIQRSTLQNAPAKNLSETWGHIFLNPKLALSRKLATSRESFSAGRADSDLLGDDRLDRGTRQDDAVDGREVAEGGSKHAHRWASLGAGRGPGAVGGSRTAYSIRKRRDESERWRMRTRHPSAAAFLVRFLTRNSDRSIDPRNERSESIHSSVIHR